MINDYKEKKVLLSEYWVVNFYKNFDVPTHLYDIISIMNLRFNWVFSVWLKFMNWEL